METNPKELIEWWILELSKADLPPHLSDRFQRIKEVWDDGRFPLTLNDEALLEVLYADYA